MAGGEDAHPHNGPPGTNGSPATPTPTPTPTPEHEGQNSSIQTTGEAMLGFALAMIFIVIVCVIIHLLLKDRRKRGLRNGTAKDKKKTKKKKKDLESGDVELHSIDKKVFEAAGVEVVLCELPEDAPPRQELDAGDDALPFSPLERGYTGTTTSSIEFNPNVVTPEDPWPEGRELATYWALR